MSTSPSLLAHKTWRTLEPYHSMIYFSPVATAAYEAIGVPARVAYFASRAAAMGAVSAEVVVATFFNFRPSLVHAGIPAVWDVASPEAILSARLDGADRQLREILGEATISSPEMVEAAELARSATEVCRPEGRPLFAGHLSLAWPAEPHLVLWHAATLLREYRGDGHIAALLAEGFDAVEALVSHGAAGDNLVPMPILKLTRGWTDEEWDAGRERLISRGWLTRNDELTDLGQAARQRVEDLTDARSVAPYAHLGEQGSDRLRSLVRPFSKALVGSGMFAAVPDGLA